MLNFALNLLHHHLDCLIVYTNYNNQMNLLGLFTKLYILYIYMKYIYIYDI